MSAATEYKIDALKQAQRNLESQIKSVQNEPRLPWRENEEWVDRVAGVKEALREITDEIIDLELSLRDPMQDAEMRYEIQCAIAASGNWHDDASHYMHTPEQERQFQEMIEHQIDYGYYDEHGQWEEGLRSGWDTYGPCSTCGHQFDREETLFADGHETCDFCNGEAISWMHFIAFVTRVQLVEGGRWSDEISFAR
jgi:hypothetical protein